MELTTSEIIEVIHGLPSQEQEKIRKTLEVDKKARLAGDLELYKKAKKWITEHRDEYMGQWVCLDGDRLISSGTDGLEVHRKAKDAGIGAPFLHRLVDESLPFGGW